MSGGRRIITDMDLDLAALRGGLGGHDWCEHTIQGFDRLVMRFLGMTPQQIHLLRRVLDVADVRREVVRSRPFCGAAWSSALGETVFVFRSDIPAAEVAERLRAAHAAILLEGGFPGD